MWIPGSVLDAPALFLAGTVSSAHCSLMCGALGALQLRGARVHPVNALFWLYGGRLGGYTAMGALAGGFGQSILRLLPDPGIGRVLQGAAALLLLLIGLRYLARPRTSPECCRPHAPRLPASWPVSLALFARGLAWAAIPCSILYSVLLLAALTGSAAAGSALLGAFALGGTPLLATAAWRTSKSTTPGSARRAGYWLVACGAAGLAAALIPTGAMSALCRGLLGSST